METYVLIVVFQVLGLNSTPSPVVVTKSYNTFKECEVAKYRLEGLKTPSSKHHNMIKQASCNKVE